MPMSVNVISGAAINCERRTCVFRYLTLAAATIAGSLALAGCGGASDDVADRPTTAAAASTPAVTVGAAEADDSVAIHIVEIKRFKFIPEVLTVKKGDRIIWKNLDVVPHTATENKQRWDSGNLNQNDAWTLIAEEVGESEYICAYHPVMKGKIVVVEL